MNRSMAQIREIVAAFLGQELGETKRAWRNSLAEIDLQPLSADGSNRRFFRVFLNGVPRCFAVLPPSDNERDMREARAAKAIASHLYQAGVPVPAIIGWDESTGLLLYEDFGDCRLHDELIRDRRAALARYPEIVHFLVKMQVQGAQGFHTSWCLDEQLYDQSVMRDRESGYFYRAFWQDTLFGGEVPGLEEEFTALAERAADYFQMFFLHRDFQSRNIMIRENRIGIIDFQAGRFGPPGYDVASLLIDPYAALSREDQSRLLQLYFEELSVYPVVDIELVRRSYPLLAVQRNLQIVGAFAFLSGQRGKTFFRGYLVPSLIMLQNRLAEPIFDDFPVLRDTVSKALAGYRRLVSR